MFRKFHRACCSAGAAILTLGCINRAPGLVMTRLEVPPAGIRLSHGLAVGQVYRGEVNIDNTLVIYGFSTIVIHMDYSAIVTVHGHNHDSGGIDVTGLVTGLSVRCSTTPGGGARVEMGALGRDLSKFLDNIEVDYTVNEDGGIMRYPEIPRHFPWQTRVILDYVFLSFETLFFTLPKDNLRVGSTWNPHREGPHQQDSDHKNGHANKMTLMGMFSLAEPSIAVAKIQILFDNTTRTIGSESTDSGFGQILMGLGDDFFINYAADYKTMNLNRDVIDYRDGVFYLRTRALWRREPPTGSIRLIQDIGDPCHRDYVGPQNCTTSTAEQE